MNLQHKTLLNIDFKIEFPLPLFYAFRSRLGRLTYIFYFQAKFVGCIVIIFKAL